MFSHKPPSTAWKKTDFHLPKKTLTNNKPKLAIRDDKETDYCKAVKNASESQKTSECLILQNEYNKKQLLIEIYLSVWLLM